MEGLVTGATSGHTTTPPQPAAAGPPAPTPATSSVQALTSESVASEGQPPPEPSSETVDLGVFTATPFYIFSQEYLPEWVSVRLPSAVSVPTALCLVHPARSPSAAERFPILLPVQPQPCRQAALLLARPAWEPVGVLILLDCREVGSSLFALLVPPRIPARLS